ncbi:hypothetical protein [Streptomyces sp. ML-6]|uniref:hypothetical protein n=1 Tax=Streptomyces sp. ML-6 TaxID=2982693 RepID=UPI0024BF86AB|nr:hypothetical protein [Streptomyces sp. ML-6]MDK0522634.1 hypothetical protein [Streptomyces sp. ML-6]
MNKSKVRILAASLAAATALGVGTAYLLEIPPFEGIGTIEAGKVCKNLGSSDKVIPALRKIAPRKPDYSFIEQQNQGLATYFSGCHGGAEDTEFLVTRTEYTALGGTFESWVNGPASKMVDTEDPKNFDRFDTATDTWGVVSKSKAAVSVPCFPDKKQSLTTIVLLWYSAEPDRIKDRYRQELVDLATSTVEFAHKDAGCTAPFKTN